MNRLLETAGSSVGAKWVMALTGLGLVGFVIAHMLGNLQVFAGADALNAYAEKLQSLGPVLWAMRLGLLGMFGLHVWAALRVTAMNRRARPVPYARPPVTIVTSFAARTMIMSGVIVALFIVFHLLHLTLGVVHADAYKVAHATTLETPDVFGMVVAGFSNPVTVGVYVLAQLVLCMHISHGLSSAFHTLGITHPSLACLKSACLGRSVAAVIFVGNVSIPLAVFLGLVGGEG